MSSGRGYTVLFGPSPPGLLGGAVVLGFLGPGEPGPRRRLTASQRKSKRLRNRMRRQAIRRARRVAT